MALLCMLKLYFKRTGAAQRGYIQIGHMHEEVLDITIEDANQSHKEIPPHTHWDAIIFLKNKTTKRENNKWLMRCREIRTLVHL